MKIGMEKSISLGSMQAKKEIIKALYDDGFTTHQISKYVALNEDEVKKILKDI